MAQQAYPSYNQIAPSWADVQTSCSIYGGELVETADVADVMCDATLEIGEQRGQGARVIRRTTGQLTETAKWTLFRAGFRTLLGKLADVAPRRGDRYQVGLVTFDVIYNHTPPGVAAGEIYKIEILGCRLSALEVSSAIGAEADKVPLTLNPGEIIFYDASGRKIVLI